MFNFWLTKQVELNPSSIIVVHHTWSTCLKRWISPLLSNYLKILNNYLILQNSFYKLKLCLAILPSYAFNLSWTLKYVTVMSSDWTKAATSILLAVSSVIAANHHSLSSTGTMNRPPQTQTFKLLVLVSTLITLCRQNMHLKFTPPVNHHSAKIQPIKFNTWTPCLWLPALFMSAG